MCSPPSPLTSRASRWGCRGSLACLQGLPPVPLLPSASCEAPFFPPLCSAFIPHPSSPLTSPLPPSLPFPPSSLSLPCLSLCDAAQVFISYGAQTNGSLLQYYGFTEPGNPNDVYAWRAALGAAPLQVRGGGRGGDGVRVGVPGGREGEREQLPWDGRLAGHTPAHFADLRNPAPAPAKQLTVNAKGSFTAECQAAARAALGGSGVDDAALRAALLAAAEAELGGKPTSIADDERLLQVRCRALLPSVLCAPAETAGLVV